MSITKKLSAIFVVAALLGQPLAALQTKGAEVLITRKTGSPFQGELLAVKPKTVVVAPSDGTSGEIFSIDIEDIGTVEIIKNSKVGLGLLLGTIAGVAVGYGIDNLSTGKSSLAGGNEIIWGMCGLLIGTIAGASAGSNTKLHFENRNNVAREWALQKLSELAALKGVR